MASIAHFYGQVANQLDDEGDLLLGEAGVFLPASRREEEKKKKNSDSLVSKQRAEMSTARYTRAANRLKRDFFAPK